MRKCPNCQINQLKTPRELATGACRICQAKVDKFIMAWWEKRFYGPEVILREAHILRDRHLKRLARFFKARKA